MSVATQYAPPEPEFMAEDADPYPRLVAVVLGYWPNRRDNVWRIVADLQASERPPNHIIVMLQGHVGFSNAYRNAKDLTVIETEGNFRTRAKFVTALLDFADCYLLMDDDTSVGRLTTARLLNMRYSGVEGLFEEGFVTGYQGVQLVNGSFMKGQNWFPAGVEKPIKVDAFHGRAIFCDYKALVNYLAAEDKVRRNPDTGVIDWPHEGDDLLVGLANDSWIFPMRGEECFVDLDQCGQALQFGTEAVPGEEHYFDMRDRFCAEALRRLGR